MHRPTHAIKETVMQAYTKGTVLHRPTQRGTVMQTIHKRDCNADYTQKGL